MEPKKPFYKRKWVIIVGVAIVVVIAALFIFSGDDTSPFETVTAKIGSISEEVSATGSVKPLKSVDLASEKTGRIARVNADVGDRVYVGDALVVLDKSELEAQLAKAEADLAAQKSDLEKAQVVLENYYDDIPNVLNDAYVKADDAVRKQLQNLFNNSESQNISLTFTTKDISIDNDVRQLRIESSSVLNQLFKDLTSAGNSKSQDELWSYLENAINRLSTIRSLLLRAMDAVVNATDSSLSSTLAETYKASISTGRTNVNAAITSLTSQKQSITSEKVAVSSLGSDVKSYEASIQNINAQIAKMTIYSPISGVVKVQDAKVGQIASANSVLTTIISANKFEVEANIPEADIAKVKKGDDAEITLDTYGNDVVFKAKVSFIEPAETVVEGVATYKTKFQFVENDERIKSGMTANITIFTAKKDNVLVIPQRAVTTKDNERSVLIDLGEGKSEERKIQVGLRGEDGNVEVIEGLKEGDEVIVNIN